MARRIALAMLSLVGALLLTAVIPLGLITTAGERASFRQDTVLLLKVCSTGYRFARYYAGDAGYRRKGAPAVPLRMLGPFVMLTSLAVLGPGVMLAVAGPAPGIWLLGHKAAFVLWFAVMTIHVLAHVWRLPGMVGGDLAGRAGRRAAELLGGRTARWLLLTASLLTGLLFAMLTVHLAGPRSAGTLGR